MPTSKKKTKKTPRIKASDLDDKYMKVRVNCWVDGDIIDELRRRAKAQGSRYQTVLNATLRQALFDGDSVEARLEKLEKAVFKKK